ncbi:MAG: LysR family transcriptional regulator [Pseudonocardiaceae bacterium]|nr:LysR family transcriptional regulator [Pseudonocardiaceae bacterium]
MIDLRRLHVLRVLHQCGTVTATADALHLTPSAVSQQIRQLAHELGVDLLLREGRRVHLTSAAHTLLQHADRLYADWEHARGELAEHAGAIRGPLRLCSFPTGLAALVAPAAARLRAAHPALTLRLIETESVGSFDLLLSGDADIAVVFPAPNSPTQDDTRFEQHTLLDDPLDLVVPETHRLADRDAVEMAELADECWIATPSTHDQHQLLLVACASAGFTPRIAHHVQEWPTVIALVAHEFGICLLPRLAPLPSHPGVARIPLHANTIPSRRILTCVRRGSAAQPAIAAGLEALREIGKEFPAPLLPPAPYDQHPPGPHRHTGDLRRT